MQLGQLDLSSLLKNRGPTPEQEQRRRLENLLAEAQLTNLQAQPGLEKRRLDLTERGQNLGAQHDTIAEELTKLGIITQADTAAKGQKGESDRAALAAKTSTTNTLIAHILGRPDIETDKAAETFKNLGAPEFANALATVHKAKIESTVPKLLSDIQGTTDPETRKARVADAFKDADIKKALLTLDPTLNQAGGGVVPKAAAPPSETPGYNPTLGANLRGAVSSLPIYASQLGAETANTTVIPASNVIASILGLPPLQRAKGATSYRDLLKR